MKEYQDFSELSLGAMRDKLLINWKHSEANLVDMSKVVFDIDYLANRYAETESYYAIGEQGEHLPNGGVLDGGMIGEEAAECRFKYKNLLFEVASTPEGLAVAIGVPGLCAPFADEVWCIFYD